MNVRAFAGSRLATAVRVAFSARRIAFQFLRAMLAVPRIPQRQTAGMRFSRAGDWVGVTAGLRGWLATKEIARKILTPPLLVRWLRGRESETGPKRGCFIPQPTPPCPR